MGDERENESKQGSPSTSYSSRAAENTAQPQPKPADDLAALLSHASLSQTAYKEFDFGLRRRRVSAKDLASATGDQQKPEQGKSDQYTDLASGAAANKNVRTTVRLVHRMNAEEQTSASGPAAGMDQNSRRFAHSSPMEVADETARIATEPDFDASSSPKFKQPSSRTDRKARPRAPANQPSPRGGLRWSVLDTLLSGEARNPQHHLVQALAQSVSVPFLLMFSASGGVGKTTIMATLGRMFADDNERVLLAETAALSLLPFSFGAQSPGQSELRSFPTPGSNAEVDILSCLQNNENVSEFAGSVRDSEGGFVSMITKAAGLANRLLLDASNVSADDILALRAKNHLALMPIVPDLNCALDLMRMEEALQDSQIKSGNEAPLYYVLNKFDSSLALHRDIRSYLQQKVGERLLPTILRRSDAIPEALAQGMTVMDYCREAGIVDDFLALRDWLRRMAPRRSSEETQP